MLVNIVCGIDVISVLSDDLLDIVDSGIAEVKSLDLLDCCIGELLMDESVVGRVADSDGAGVVVEMLVSEEMLDNSVVLDKSDLVIIVGSI